MNHRTRGLIFVLPSLLGLQGSACESAEKPCTYDELPLSAGEQTPWGAVAEQDIAELAGPHMGVWRWSETNELFEVAESGAEIEAIATFEPDLSTLRELQLVGGDVCESELVHVDGELIFQDLLGQTIVALDVTVELTRSTRVSDFESTMAGFSSSVEATDEGGGIVGSFRWGEEQLDAEFAYVVDRASASEGGYVVVARFSPQ